MTPCSTSTSQRDCGHQSRGRVQGRRRPPRMSGTAAPAHQARQLQAQPASQLWQLLSLRDKLCGNGQRRALVSHLQRRGEHMLERGVLPDEGNVGQLGRQHVPAGRGGGAGAATLARQYQNRAQSPSHSLAVPDHRAEDPGWINLRADLVSHFPGRHMCQSRPGRAGRGRHSPLPLLCSPPPPGARTHLYSHWLSPSYPAFWRRPSGSSSLAVARYPVARTTMSA